MGDSEFVQDLIDSGLIAKDVDQSIKDVLDNLDTTSQTALKAALVQVKSYIPDSARNPLVFI